MHFNSVCDVTVLQLPPDNASAYCWLASWSYIVEFDPILQEEPVWAPVQMLVARGVMKQLSVTYPKHALLDIGPGI